MLNNYGVSKDLISKMCFFDILSALKWGLYSLTQKCIAFVSCNEEECISDFWGLHLAITIDCDCKQRETAYLISFSFTVIFHVYFVIDVFNYCRRQLIAWCKCFDSSNSSVHTCQLSIHNRIFLWVNPIVWMNVVIVSDTVGAVLKTRGISLFLTVC